MSYTLPSPYKCVKCGYEFSFTPDDLHSAPVLRQEVEGERGVYTKHLPACPICFAQFIRNNVPLGYSTEVWTAEGSDYERARAEANAKIEIAHAATP